MVTVADQKVMRGAGVVTAGMVEGGNRMVHSTGSEVSP